MGYTELRRRCDDAVFKAQRGESVNGMTFDQWHNASQQSGSSPGHVLAWSIGTNPYKHGRDCSWCGVEHGATHDPDCTEAGKLDVSNDMGIAQFIHCMKCMPDKPNSVTPREWAKLDVGFTKPGLQVWCKRCEANVVHIDFQGQRHPANTTYKK